MPEFRLGDAPSDPRGTTGTRKARWYRWGSHDQKKPWPIREQLASKLSTGGEKLLEHIDRQRELDRDRLKSLLGDVETHATRDVADPAKLARS